MLNLLRVRNKTCGESCLGLLGPGLLRRGLALTCLALRCSPCQLILVLVLQSWPQHQSSDLVGCDLNSVGLGLSLRVLDLRLLVVAVRILLFAVYSLCLDLASSISLTFTEEQNSSLSSKHVGRLISKSYIEHQKLGKCFWFHRLHHLLTSCVASDL